MSALAQYIHSRLDKSGACWAWMGAKRRGKGYLKINGRRHDPRRVLYIEEVGPLPRGARLGSVCGNHLCCRTAHSTPPPQDARSKFLERTQIIDGHRIWCGYKLSSGYGRYYFEGRWQQAHRVAYELFVGAIPEGCFVRQKCKNRLCVDQSDLIAVPAVGPFGLKYKIPTAEVVAAIRERAKAKGTNKEIADEFGTTTFHVSRILNGTYRIGREKQPI